MEHFSATLELLRIHEDSLRMDGDCEIADALSSVLEVVENVYPRPDYNGEFTTDSDEVIADMGMVTG